MEHNCNYYWVHQSKLLQSVSDYRLWRGYKNLHNIDEFSRNHSNERKAFSIGKYIITHVVFCRNAWSNYWFMCGKKIGLFSF